MSFESPVPGRAGQGNLSAWSILLHPRLLSSPAGQGSERPPAVSLPALPSPCACSMPLPCCREALKEWELKKKKKKWEPLPLPLHTSPAGRGAAMPLPAKSPAAGSSSLVRLSGSKAPAAAMKGAVIRRALLVLALQRAGNNALLIGKQSLGQSGSPRAKRQAEEREGAPGWCGARRGCETSGLNVQD